MSEEQNDQKKEPTKVTLGLVLGWGLGLLAAISGVTLLFSEPLTGILILLLAAVLLPPTNKFVAEKFNFSISGGLKAIVVIGLLTVIGISMPTDSQADNNTSENQESEARVEEESSPEIENNSNSSATQNQPTQIQGEPEQEPETPSETVSQKNAVRKAKLYLNYTAFSRNGLVEQLKFDQFSHADVVGL